MTQRRAKEAAGAKSGGSSRSKRQGRTNSGGSESGQSGRRSSNRNRGRKKSAKGRGNRPGASGAKPNSSPEGVSQADSEAKHRPGMPGESRGSNGPKAKAHRRKKSKPPVATTEPEVTRSSMEVGADEGPESTGERSDPASADSPPSGVPRRRLVDEYPTITAMDTFFAIAKITILFLLISLGVRALV